MEPRTIRYVVLFGLALIVLTVACDTPVTNNPTNPSAPPVSRFEILGPTNLPTGQSVQLTANVTLADGTVKAASLDTGVVWRSSNTAAVQVTQTGIVTAIASQGEANITAQWRVNNNDVRSVTREVIIQPTGTFRLMGTVFEDGFSSIQVEGARVEVLPGSPFAIANAVGQYRLYGLPPEVEVRVSADGYETRTFSLQLSGNTFRSFALPLTAGRPLFNGSYTLFIDAVTCPPSFAPPLPSELQHRAYEAELTQTGTQIRVKLVGGQFRTDSQNKGDNFTGFVVAGGARFFLDSYAQFDYYGSTGISYPSVAERLPDGRYLVPDGEIRLTGAPDSGLSGTFNFASLSLWDANFPDFASKSLGRCAGQTTMRFVPR